MAMRRLRKHHEAADLEMTPFISLLVVLVPFLLLTLVFSHITVLQLKLPDAAGGGGAGDPLQNEEVELVIRQDHLEINFPRGVLVKSIPDTAGGAPDFAALSGVLQELKHTLVNMSKDKKAITILSETNTDYQTLVTAMDTARSYKTTIATSVVDAELFPEIAFGDAPEVAADDAAPEATR
jgi:biopolymer transport protein ExbD